MYKTSRSLVNDELVCSFSKGIILQSSRQRQVVVQFQLHACIDQFRAIIRVYLLDLPPPAEVLDGPDDGVSVSSRSWLSHDSSGIYVPNNERIPAFHFMIS